MQFDQKYRGGSKVASGGRHNSDTETESEPVDVRPLKIVSDLEVKMLGGAAPKKRYFVLFVLFAMVQFLRNFNIKPIIGYLMFSLVNN